ncbi:MAG: ribose 5-phosphate isomerase A [Bacillus sp. (in: firmicutes)]
MVEDIKKKCAKEAMQFIKNDTIIGLGAGTTISHLVQYIKENEHLKVKIVTPSLKTKMLCVQNGLEVLHTETIDSISVAFDGCDEVDENFFALKSGGGIHTKEKLIANMADDYILLIDSNKFVKSLTFKHPVVLEVLKDALSYVEKQVTALGGKVVARTSAAKDGLTISDDGHLLLDVYFNNVYDICQLQTDLKNICGVIETSLFTDVVTKLLITNEDGTTLLLSKDEVQ